MVSIPLLEPVQPPVDMLPKKVELQPNPKSKPKPKPEIHL
jgi:hypothetical protein